MNEDKEQPAARKNNAMQYAALGTELLAILGAAVWGGLWLDKKSGLSPLFLIVLPLVGLVVVFVQLYRNLTKK